MNASPGSQRVVLPLLAALLLGLAFVVVRGRRTETPAAPTPTVDREPADAGQVVEAAPARLPAPRLPSVVVGAAVDMALMEWEEGVEEKFRARGWAATVQRIEARLRSGMGGVTGRVAYTDCTEPPCLSVLEFNGAEPTGVTADDGKRRAELTRRARRAFQSFAAEEMGDYLVDGTMVLEMSVQEGHVVAGVAVFAGPKWPLPPGWHEDSDPQHEAILRRMALLEHERSMAAEAAPEAATRSGGAVPR